MPWECGLHECFYSSSKHMSTPLQSHSLLHSPAAAIPTYLLHVLSFVNYVFFKWEMKMLFFVFNTLVLFYWYYLLLTLLKLTWYISSVQTLFCLFCKWYYFTAIKLDSGNNVNTYCPQSQNPDLTPVFSLLLILQLFIYNYFYEMWLYYTYCFLNCFLQPRIYWKNFMCL